MHLCCSKTILCHLRICYPQNTSTNAYICTIQLLVHACASNGPFHALKNYHLYACMHVSGRKDAYRSWSDAYRELYVCLHICMYLDDPVNVCMFAILYMYVCLHVCMCVSGRTCTFMHVCMYVCICALL